VREPGAGGSHSWQPEAEYRAVEDAQEAAVNAVTLVPVAEPAANENAAAAEPVADTVVAATP
jgi:hypothetical protein